MPPFSLRGTRGGTLACLVVSLVFTLSGGALAYDGFTVGLMGGLPTGGAYVVNAHAVQPLVDGELHGSPLQLSARAELSAPLSFRSPPAFGLAAVSSAVGDGIERYLGVGAGVSFLGSAPLWSLYGLVGFRAPLAQGLYGVLEVQLASNRLVTAPNLGLALEYTFGGR